MRGGKGLFLPKATRLRRAGARSGAPTASGSLILPAEAFAGAPGMDSMHAAPRGAAEGFRGRPTLDGNFDEGPLAPPSFDAAFDEAFAGLDEKFDRHFFDEGPLASPSFDAEFHEAFVGLDEKVDIHFRGGPPGRATSPDEPAVLGAEGAAKVPDVNFDGRSLRHPATKSPKIRINTPIATFICAFVICLLAIVVALRCLAKRSEAKERAALGGGSSGAYHDPTMAMCPPQYIYTDQAGSGAYRDPPPKYTL